MPSRAEDLPRLPASLGVIGLGRMAQALLQPLLEDGQLLPSAVVASVATEPSAEGLRASLGVTVGLDARPCLAAPVLLLALKPQQLDGLLQSLNPLPPPPSPPPGLTRPLLVSVLAGVGLQRLQGAFPGWDVVRCVPNAPALVRRGLIGVSDTGSLEPAARRLAHALLSPVGRVLDLPEAQLDAFLALTSSGPAFMAVVIEALADGGVAAGLPRTQALELARAMAAGSLELLEQRQLHPAELKDMVASPGGTTMAGLRRLEAAGIRSALIEAVLAAYERSRALA
ncbi:MAG: pyrroline-5-carboxylate reductase [Synechococcus sp.]